MNLKSLIETVRRYWATFTVVAVAVMALGLATLLLTPVRYVSTTQLLVAINGSTTATAYQNDDLVTGRVHSYIALLTTDVVSQAVIDKLGLTMTAPELASEINATNVPPDTSIIDVAVTASSPQQAQRLADAIGAEFVSYTDTLETPTGEDGQKVHTTVVTGASAPDSRVADKYALGVLILLAALLVGVVAVWIRSLFDPVVRTAERAAAAAAGVPVLGTVTSADVKAVTALEGYRRLRARLQSLDSTEVGRVWMLASANEGGTAVIASNLARVTELAGRRTLVLESVPPVQVVPESEPQNATDIDHHDGDDEQAGTDEAEPLPEPELGEWSEPFSLTVWPVDSHHFDVNAAADFIGGLRREYDQLIIASPPVLSSFTASVLSEFADVVVIVVSADTTKRRALGQAAKVLDATGAPLKGLLLLSQDHTDDEPAPVDTPTAPTTDVGAQVEAPTSVH